MWTLRQREPVLIAPEVREELQDLLLSRYFEGTGAGYSALVKAAIDLAHGNKDFRDRVVSAQFSINALDSARLR